MRTIVSCCRVGAYVGKQRDTLTLAQHVVGKHIKHDDDTHNTLAPCGNKHIASRGDDGAKENIPNTLIHPWVGLTDMS